MGVIHSFLGRRMYRKKQLFLASFAMLILTVGFYRFISKTLVEFLPFIDWLNILILMLIIIGSFLVSNRIGRKLKFKNS